MSGVGLKTVLYVGGCGILSYFLMIVVRPDEEKLRKEIMAKHLDVMKAPVRVNKPIDPDAAKRAKDFRRVLTNTMTAKETVYGAKSAKAQGIHDIKDDDD